MTGDGRGSGSRTIYEEVYGAIVDHRLPPGTKLTEDALGEAFGVSRTVVRKALFELAHENVVRIRPHRGAVVASPTVDEARDVFAARRVVEPAIVRRVADEAGLAEIEVLRALAADERAAHARGDRRAWIRLSGGYHLELAAMAGNDVLADFLKELVSRTSLIIALYEAPGAAACSFDDHDAVTAAIADGDGERAAAVMAAHLQACEDRLDLTGEARPVDLARVFARPSAAE